MEEPPAEPALRLRIHGIEITGRDPNHVAELLERLRTAGALNDPAQARFNIHPALPRVTMTDDEILRTYAEQPGLSRERREQHARVARDFHASLQGRSIITATKDDVRAYERLLLEQCRWKRVTPLQGRYTMAAPRVRCDKGEYGWRTSPPATCCRACPLWERQRTGPLARLRAIADLYDHLHERDLVQSNPARLVAKKHAKSLGADPPGRKKYSPTLDDARRLIHASMVVGTPWHVATLLLLMKWGRRPGHTTLMHVEDLYHMREPPGRAIADFSGVRERVLARNLDGYSKLQENLLSVVDRELHDYLTKQYLPYRSETWTLEPDTGPLLPATFADRHMHDLDIQRQVLDPAMQWLEKNSRTAAEREKWRNHRLPRSKTRISPGTWRYFFTRELTRAGVDSMRIDILRGDRTPGSKRSYLELEPETLHSWYKMPDLLSMEA